MPAETREFVIKIYDKEDNVLIAEHDTRNGIIAYSTQDSNSPQFDMKIHILGREEKVISIINSIINKIDSVTPLVCFINKTYSRMPIFDLMRNHGKEV